MKPNLTFNGFKQPWKKVKLEELGSFRGGGTPDSSNNDFWRGTIPWISSSDVGEGFVNKISITRKITEEAILNSAAKKIPKDSILIVSRVGVGKFGIAPQELCTSQDFTNFITNENSYFLANYFLSKSTKFKRLSQGTSIKGFTSKEIKKLEFFLPGMLEQKKIASFLSSVDAKIHQLQKKKDLLDQYKKGIMQRLFSQEIRFKQEDGSVFPDWEHKPLNNFLEVSNDRNFDLLYSKDQVLSVSGELGVLNQIEHLGRSYAGESVHNYHILREGEIVYTKSPLKRNPYGIIKLNEGDTGIVSTLYAVYKCKSNVRGKYLDYYFQLDDNVNKYLRPLVRKGAKNDMKINNQYVLHDPLIIPTVQEQDRIITFLQSLDRKIRIETIVLEKAIEFKKGLLQQMFV